MVHLQQDGGEEGGGGELEHPAGQALALAQRRQVEDILRPAAAGTRWELYSHLSCLHVILTGCSAHWGHRWLEWRGAATWGGMTMRMPDLLLPVMAPPRASTRKLHRPTRLQNPTKVQKQEARHAFDPYCDCCSNNRLAPRHTHRALSEAC